MEAQSTVDVPRTADADASDRRLGRESLTLALQQSRQRTLALCADLTRALGPQMPVPRSEELNPPLWELGHVGWFADWWIARNPHRQAGLQADPLVARLPARQRQRRRDADALYNSSEVAHGSRWDLDLPDLEDTLDDLQASLTETLQRLDETSENDDGLYFFRLALYHEDMHAEAAVHMAQTLGVTLGPEAARGTAEPRPAVCTAAGPREISIDATDVRLGWDGPGFAFDNELGAHTEAVSSFRIDTAAVTWARFLPFVEAGGYRDPRWWSPAGWQWLCHSGARHPRHLRREGAGWSGQQHGRWLPVQTGAPAVHLNAHEAEAWCRWAGRRLPTEAEWMAAARHAHWQGMQVWEWTASRFQPFPGFEAHPYRDYSAPWFDGRPVLKGASPATAARLRHPAYRNFYTPQRNDILAGFRSVAA